MSAPSPADVPRCHGMADSYGLFCHGVGKQTEGYSSAAQKWLSAAREPHGGTYGSEVLWSQILDAPEQAMMREVGKRGSANRPLQRLVVETLADALSYRNRLPALLERFDMAYARLRAPDAINLYCHSLGVVLGVEWLRQRPSVRVNKFISFGVNLQLFHLGAEGQFVSPPQLARAGVWESYFSDTDCLGFPIRGWIPQATDTEVEVGGWFTRWNGLSHLAYWDDKAFWKKQVAPRTKVGPSGVAP